MTHSLNFLTRYPIRTAAIVFTLIGVFTAIPKMQSQVTTAQAEQQIRLQAQSQSRLMDATNDGKAKYLEARAQLAEDRYQAGVIFVADPNNPDVLTTITEGRPVSQKGSTTGATLPDGTVVGDINGNTGIIAGGVVTDLAYTGNQTIVRAAYDRLINPTKEETP
jgi:hypothetical protein